MERVNGLSSIDEFADVYQHRQFDGVLTSDGEQIDDDEVNWDFVSPEEEFVAHCSNLQAWVEHDYDTRLLKADLAFPLLKKLANEGDEQARFRLKEEILKRYESGYKPVIEYLFTEGFFDYLDGEEQLYGLLIPQDAENLKALQEELNIEFYFVPDLSYSKEESSYGKPSRQRTFSTKNKSLTGIDLNHLDLKIVPLKLIRFEKLKIIDLSNQEVNLNNRENKARISNIESLGLIITDKEMIKRTTKPSILEYKRKGITISSNHIKNIDLIKKIS